MVAHDDPATTTAATATTTTMSVTGVCTTAEHHAENCYERKCP